MSGKYYENTMIILQVLLELSLLKTSYQNLKNREHIWEKGPIGN